MGLCQATIESRHGDDPELGSRAQAPLFAIVNNAGVMEGPLEDVLRVRAAAAVFCAAYSATQVNLHGPALVSKHFLPLLQPGGRVVMVRLTLFVAGCLLVGLGLFSCRAFVCIEML